MANSCFQFFVIIIVLGFINITGVDGQSNQQQSEACSCPTLQPVYLPPGLPGVQGPQGLTGPAGDPGIPAIPGHPGGQGLKGEQGQGSPGQRGEPGQKGDDGGIGSGPRGAPGKMGPQGIIGITGRDGVRGHPGDKGAPGTSYTPPAMSAFSAQLYRDLPGSQTITFDAETLDLGNDFDHTTGIFTCRIPGLYSFTFTISKYQRDVMEVHLTVNGQTKANIYTNTNTADSIDRYSQNVLLMLQQGNQVKLETIGDLFVLDGAHYNFFNGYLIHAT